MTPNQQTAALEADLHAVIDRYRQEFDLSLAQAVGVLECVKLAVWKQQVEDLEDENTNCV